MELIKPVLAEKREAEVEFWSGLIGSVGVERFLGMRKFDLEFKTRFFPGIHEEKGLGLDLACGLLSIFEFSKLRVVAADALLDQYEELLPRGGTQENDLGGRVEYQRGDGEHLQFSDEMFDFVFCCNAIDHTPNPSRMVSEIERVLRPGGRLYFSVNYDPSLYAPHYQLWNRDMVDAHLKNFQTLLAVEEWLEQYHKFLFWGVHRKPC